MKRYSDIAGMMKTAEAGGNPLMGWGKSLMSWANPYVEKIAPWLVLGYAWKQKGEAANPYMANASRSVSAKPKVFHMAKSTMRPNPGVDPDSIITPTVQEL